MKKIIFLAILGALLLQGCKTTDAKKEAKPLEMNPEKLMTSSSKGHGLSLIHI